MDTAIAGAERTYDQLVAALDAQYGSLSSNGDTGIEGARRQAAISTRDAQYYASRDTSWAGLLSGSATIGNTPWTLKAIASANAQAAYSTNRASAQAAHDAALLSAIDNLQTSNRSSTLSLLVAEGQSREAYNKATATVFANWEMGVGNLLGDKPAGTGWEGRTGENNTETTNGEYGGMGGFLNFNWFGEEDEEEEESDTPERPEEPSTAEYVNDKIVHYRDAIKSTPVGFSWQSPFEKWVQKTVRDLAVDVIAGGVAVSAHDTIKKVDPTVNADAAFLLAWFGESSIPSLMTTNDRVNGQTAEFLQSLARDKAIELNRGHAGLSVSGTPLMDEVAIEAPASLLSFGLPKMLGMGARVSKEISEEGIELVLDAARRVDDEAIEAAAKARQVLDNCNHIPLEKILDDAPVSGGKGLVGLVKPGGMLDDTLKAHYLSIVRSPQMASAVERYNKIARFLGQKPSASIDEIAKALGNDVTFAKIGHLKAGVFESGHAGTTRFWLQGNPTTAYGRRVGRHELTHIGAALRGQGDTWRHEIAVQLATTPENLVALTVGFVVVIGGEVYWLTSQ